MEKVGTSSVSLRVACERRCDAFVELSIACDTCSKRILERFMPFVSNCEHGGHDAADSLLSSYLGRVDAFRQSTRAARHRADECRRWFKDGPPPRRPPPSRGRERGRSYHPESAGCASRPLPLPSRCLFPNSEKRRCCQCSGVSRRDATRSSRSSPHGATRGSTSSRTARRSALAGCSSSSRP